MCRVCLEWWGLLLHHSLCLIHVSKSLRTRCLDSINSIHPQSNYCLLQFLRLFKYVSNWTSSYFDPIQPFTQKTATPFFQLLKSQIRSHPDIPFFSHPTSNPLRSPVGSTFRIYPETYGFVNFPELQFSHLQYWDNSVIPTPQWED